VLLAAISLARDRWNADAEQYAVYSAFIQYGLAGESHSKGDRNGPLLILEQTTMASDLSYIQGISNAFFSLLQLQRRPKAPPLFQICALFLKNLRRHELGRRFAISADYQLIGAVDLSLLAIYQQYPRSHGFLTFSPVAFSFDEKEALFYTEHICGLCGGGQYVLLRKIGSEWSVAKSYGTWIS